MTISDLRGANSRSSKLRSLFNPSPFLLFSPRFTKILHFHMYIIEIYVKNRFRQLLSGIIIPMTSVVHPVSTSLVATHQMPPRITYCLAVGQLPCGHSSRELWSSQAASSVHIHGREVVWRHVKLTDNVVRDTQRGAQSHLFFCEGWIL